MHWLRHAPKYGLAVTLLAGCFCLIFSALREPETVVVIVARKQVRALPPFEFITDRDRLLGLVFEPLCPPPPSQRPLQLSVPAVAACSVKEGHVRVKLREGLLWQGKRLDARQVELLLGEQAARAKTTSGAPPLWAKIDVLNDNELRLWSIPTARSADGLRFALAELYMGGDHDGCRLGTGPWVEARCQAGDLAYKKSLLPAALRESQHVTDVALLRRQDAIFERRQILVVGWDAEAGREKTYVALLDPLARALQAEAGERVHFIRGLEAPEIDVLRGKLPTSAANWSLVGRRGDRAAWLVARPTLSKARRLKLLTAAREVLQEPGYFDESRGSPLHSLLPEVYPPLVFSSASGKPADCGERVDPPDTTEDESRIPTLLTHTRWRSLAEALKDQESKKASANGPANVLDVLALNASDEAAMRRSGRYELSIQSPVALDASHPSRIFADNLPVWFQADHPLVRTAQRITEAEAQDPSSATADLKSLMHCLDTYMLPISSPPSWVVVHRDLRGWNAAADWLDPDDVGLRSYRYRWLDWLGVVLIVSTIPLYGLRRRQQAERARNAAEIARFHHDLSSPLASIRAEAEYIHEQLAVRQQLPDETLRSSAGFIDQQTAHVIDLVDNLRAVSGPDGWSGDQDAACALAPVLQAETAALERRAQWEHLDLRIQAQVLDVRIALPESSLRRVLRNVLDNACKYRNPEADAIDIRIKTWFDSRQFVMDIEDDGLGFGDFPAKRHFAPGERGRSARERGLPGQGLGLSGAQRLLASANATMEIHQLGNPTRIRLRLPMAHGSTT